MKASCGTCGANWHQSGNRTGHCGGRDGCHFTFGSTTAFDRHQLGNEDVVCRHPSSLGLHPVVDKHGAEVWKFPPPEGGLKAVFE